MKIDRLLKKMCAITLAAALIGGSAVTVLPAVTGTYTGIVAYAAEYGDFEYSQETNNGPVTITKYKGTDTKIVIPSTINGYPVTSIGDSTFWGCGDLTSITIPDSVTSIGDSAFRYCYSLTNITIPDSVTIIGSSAFRYCYSLKNITIPDNIMSICDSAFYGCSGLTNLTIGNGLTSIDRNEFAYCSSLTSITIPDSVTTIGYQAFYNCSSLTSIIIPDSVTTIGDYAFRDCSNLTSITIPSSVTNIGEYAFGYFLNNSSEYKKIDDFTIYGESGSVAEAYAKDIGFKFVDITEKALKNKTTVTKTNFNVGETITVKGAASGGTGPYTYEFYYKRSTASSWTKFDKNGVGTFKPGSAGTFTIKTYVKDSTGKASVKEFTLTATSPLTNNTTVTKTNFNVGETITVKGAASGGTGPYTYEFYYKRSTASSWTKFDKNGVGTFKPGSAGTFTIKTYVKDSTGKASVKEFTLTATSPLTNNTTVTKTNFNVGETITVKGAASGGTGPYTYEFYYKRSTASSWTKFDKNGVGTFKPGSAGTFTIKTYVKDSTGKASVKEFTLTATAPLSNNTTVTKTNFNVGETITVKGAASGGTGPYTYEFYYKRSTASSWTKFDKNGVGTFKPGSAGTFTIKTYVKDSTGKASVKEFTLTAK